MSTRARLMLIIGTIVIFSGVTAWQCTKSGRYRDPEEDEASCNHYVTCIPGANSTFNMRQDECSSGNLFSAKYQRCIAGDDCDTLEDFYAIEYECKECGKFVNIKSKDCRQYVNCLRTKDYGVFIPIKQSCPKEQLFSAVTQSCVPENSYQCPFSLVKFVSDFVCLDIGKYPDETVPNCRGYRLCSKLKNGTLVSTNFMCDDDYIFSESDQICVSPEKYDCPDDENDYVCPSVGRFPNKLSRTCKTFFNCLEDSDAGIKSSLSTCPEGTIFSETTFECVSPLLYACSTTWIEIEPVTQRTDGTSTARRVTADEETFICRQSGAFASEEDERCLTYYLCSLDANNNWIKVTMQCTIGYVFSSEHRRCVGSTEYTCPVLATISSDALSITSSPDTVFTTELFSEDLTEKCAGIGRVLNTEDRNCRSYFLCSFNSEYELTRSVIVCPEGSLFSTFENKCVKNDGTVQCPIWASNAATTQDNNDESGDGTDGSSSLVTTVLFIDSINEDNLEETLSASNTEVAELSNTIMTTLPIKYEYPCTATGRFADINSVDCKSYFLCTENKIGSFESVHLNCPEGMVFSRNINKCVISTKYLC